MKGRVTSTEVTTVSIHETRNLKLIEYFKLLTNLSSKTNYIGHVDKVKGHPRSESGKKASPTVLKVRLAELLIMNSE